MKKCSNPCSRAWHQISEFGEWRFERKCFRANIETSAAKIRRSSRIRFCTHAVVEVFVAVQNDLSTSGVLEKIGSFFSKDRFPNLLLLFLSEVRWFADRRVVSTCQRRDTYRNLDFCLRAKRQDLAFVVIQNA